MRLIHLSGTVLDRGPDWLPDVLELVRRLRSLLRSIVVSAFASVPNLSISCQPLFSSPLRDLHHLEGLRLTGVAGKSLLRQFSKSDQLSPEPMLAREDFSSGLAMVCSLRDSLQG
jgi:hypothetical protein